MASKPATRSTARTATAAGRAQAAPPARPAPTGKPVTRAPASAPREPAPVPETRRPPASHPAPAVRKQTGGAIAISRDDAPTPAFMQADAGMGTENMSQADMEVPRLKLIQGTSKELTEYDQLRPGYFFHTAQEHVFDAPFLAVPIFYDKRYLLWRPLDDNGGILARSDDAIHWSPPNVEFTVKLDKKDGGHTVTWTTADTVAQSGLAEWGSQNPNDPNSPPAATLMYNFLLAFPEYPDLMPAAFTFQRSTIKAGKRFITKLRTSRDPIFGRVFQFGATDETNSTGKDFKGVQVTGYGKISDPEAYAGYKALHESFAAMGIRLRDEEGLQGEDGGTGDADDAADEPGKPKY